MMDKARLFAEQIKTISSTEWTISLDATTFEIRIVDKNGTEIESSALGFILNELEDYSKKIAEELHGENRKFPIDEFTKRRQGLGDYVLVKDEDSETARTIFEVYHDDNEILTLQSFNVWKKNNLIYHDFTAHLSVKEAEQILPTIKGFIQKYRKR